MNLGSVWVRRRASLTARNEVRCPCSSLFRGGQGHATYERLDGLTDCARLNPDSSSSAHSFFIRRTLDQVFATVGLLSSHMVNEVAEAPLFPHVEPVLELLVSVQALRDLREEETRPEAGWLGPGVITHGKGFKCFRPGGCHPGGHARRDMPEGVPGQGCRHTPVLRRSLKLPRRCGRMAVRLLIRVVVAAIVGRCCVRPGPLAPFCLGRSWPRRLRSGAPSAVRDGVTQLQCPGGRRTAAG